MILCGEPCVVACDEHFHRQCVVCECCNRIVQDDFIELPDAPGCVVCSDECYAKYKMQQGNLVCTRCRFPIDGNYMTIEDQFYHKECFSCQTCHKLFDTDEVFFINSDCHCRDCALKILASAPQ